MKLIGSLRESTIRTELIEFQKNTILNKKAALHQFLIELEIDVASSFIIDWIPEQNEDIYTIYVVDKEILIAEISRDGHLTSTEKFSLLEYTKKASKHTRIVMSVANDIYATGSMKELHK